MVLEDGEEIDAPRGGHHAPPEDRLPRPARAHADLPDDFVTDIERWKTRSGVVKINLALSELPNFTADPATAGRAPHRLGRDGTVDRVHGGGLPGRPRRTCGRRGPSATESSPPRGTRRSPPRAPTSCRCSPSGSPSTWSEEPHTEELEAYADRIDRLLRRGGPQLQGIDPPPRRGRSLRDGAGVRPHRRQHLPRRAVARAALPHAARPGLRRLPHARSRASTTAARPPTPAAASAGSPGWQAARAALADKKAATDWALGAAQLDRRVSPAGRVDPSRCGPCSRPGGWPWSGPAGGRAASATGWCPRSPAAPPALELHLVNPRYDEVLGRPCARLARRRSTARSTWCCSGVADRRVEEQLTRPRHAGATGRRSSTAACSSPTTRRRRRRATGSAAGSAACRRAWPCAAAAAWGSSTWPRPAGHRLRRARRAPARARSPSSPTRARSSRRCCGPGATSGSPWSCRPARSW